MKYSFSRQPQDRAVETQTLQQRCKNTTDSLWFDLRKSHFILLGWFRHPQKILINTSVYTNFSATQRKWLQSGDKIVKVINLWPCNLLVINTLQLLFDCSDLSRKWEWTNSWQPNFRRGTCGFVVLMFFFYVVMQWIKSQFVVLRWSQILGTAIFVFFMVWCSVKLNFL